jgi:hypothetical protein
MMRSLFLLFGLCSAGLFASCECEQGHNRSVDSSRSATEKQSRMVRDVCCASRFRTMVETMGPQDSRFSLSYDERSISRDGSPSCLPHPFLSAEVHLPPLAPNSTYILYCPHTGCPLQPEYYQEVSTDGEGNPMPAQMVEELQKHDIRCTMALMIMLYANPGYCSDWFLITLAPSFSALHTTFTYKPITVSDAKGRTMTLSKREPGGNLIEISLTGFPPKKRLLLTSVSAGEKIAHPIDTDNAGAYTTMMAPQVIGVTNGVNCITISAEGICLQASCEWDISSMDIARRQAPSPMWKYLQSCVQ